MRIIDTHAHYDDEAFAPDREELLDAMAAGGVERIVNVGASLEGARESVRLAGRYPGVYAGVGIHPDHVGQLSDQVMDELAALSREPKCVVFGEIGLDYHWDVEPRQVQRDWFARQLQLALRLGLPINVHSREAAQDTLEIIRSEHAGRGTGVIHCYSGSLEMAREYVKLGYFLGIGGVVTFRNAKTLKKVVEEIPLSHLVTETDSPYMAPTPHRGSRNTSLNLPLVIDEIARLKGLEREETAETLYENALRVYRWPRV